MEDEFINTCESGLQEILSGAKVVILTDFSSCDHLLIGNNSISLFCHVELKDKTLSFFFFFGVFSLLFTFSFSVQFYRCNTCPCFKIQRAQKRYILKTDHIYIC